MTRIKLIITVITIFFPLSIIFGQEIKEIKILDVYDELINCKKEYDYNIEFVHDLYQINLFYHNCDLIGGYGGGDPRLALAIISLLQENLKKPINALLEKCAIISSLPLNVQQEDDLVAIKKLQKDMENLKSQLNFDKPVDLDSTKSTLALEMLTILRAQKIYFVDLRTRLNDLSYKRSLLDQSLRFKHKL